MSRHPALQALALGALIAAVAAATPAAAAPDEPPAGGPTYDLRARYTPTKGDALRVVERVKNDIDYAIKGDAGVIERQQGQQGLEQRYDEEVLEVDAARKEVTSAIRTYTGLTDYASGETLDLSAAPVKVRMTRSPEGEVRFEPLDAAVTVPPLLQNVLDMESGQRRAPGAGEEDEEVKRLFPDRPVASGTTWPIPVDLVASIFGMGDAAEYQPGTAPPGAPATPALDAEKSSASGALEAVEVTDGVTLLRVKVTVKLALRRFQGMECPTPMTFEGSIAFRLSAGGTSPVGDAIMEAAIKGAARPPAGMVAEMNLPASATLEFDMKLSNAKSVGRLPAKR